MSEGDSTDKAQRERIDKLCDRFEVAWTNGWQKESIENELADVAEPDRAAALCQVIQRQES